MAALSLLTLPLELLDGIVRQCDQTERLGQTSLHDYRVDLTSQNPQPSVKHVTCSTTASFAWACHV